MTPFTLKDNIQLGVGLPATQCEGGELESSWVYWWGLGYIRDNASPAVAAQHAQRWREDVALLRELGVQAVCLGLDWTRLEPEKDGFDEEALAYYRDELSALKDAGIGVTLVLHHFTSPAWFEALGGFEREENLPLFLSYVSHVSAALGGLVSEYLTFAEPNAYAAGGYLGGDYPPGKNNLSSCYRVLTHMAQCHILSCDLLRSMHREMGYAPCRIGVSLRAQEFTPCDPRNPSQKLLCAAAERAFDAAFRAFYLGQTRLPMKYNRYLVPGSYADFISLDWRGRSPVSEPLDLTPFAKRDGSVCPEALLRQLTRLHRLVPLPIHVTLSGAEDGHRADALLSCLSALSGSALPVERFCYSPLLDGFEMLDGISRRLGLVHVDFDTQERTLKPSARLYRTLLLERGVSGALLEQYDSLRSGS